MTDTLQSLLERVEAATGPDREIDARLECIWFGWSFERMPTSSEGTSGFFAYEKTGSTAIDRLIRVHDFKRYTASVDAALALVERMLPRWKVSLFIGHLTGAKDGSGARAELRAPGRPKRIAPQDWKWPKVSVCYHAPTAPLAILAALLRAKIAETSR